MTRVTLLLARYRVALLIVLTLLLVPAWLRYVAWVLGACPFWTPAP